MKKEFLSIKENVTHSMSCVKSSIKETANYIGVSLSTLFRTIGLHRRYKISNLEEKFNLNKEKIENKKIVGYARVSTHSQKEDLLTQQKVLNNITKTNNYKDFMIILDLRSGLNYKKKGLNQLIEFIASKKISKIIITHKDRLIRFGFELIQKLCSLFNVEISILYNDEKISEDQIFCNDLCEIVTVFSSRLYGKRSHKNKKLLALQLHKINLILIFQYDKLKFIHVNRKNDGREKTNYQYHDRIKSRRKPTNGFVGDFPCF